MKPTHAYSKGTLQAAGSTSSCAEIVHGALVYVAPYWIVVEPLLRLPDGESGGDSVYIYHEQRVESVFIPPFKALEETLRGEEPDLIDIRWPTDAEVEAHIASVWRKGTP